MTLSPGCGIGSSITCGTSIRSPRILRRIRLWRFRILTGRYPGLEVRGNGSVAARAADWLSVSRRAGFR
jgi:hypothetical protein